MNQLINFESMSIEEIKEMELQLTKKKVELLQKDIEMLVSKTDHHEIAIKEIDNKTEYLKENLTVDVKGANAIHRMGKLKVTDALGGKDSEAYKQLSRKAFANFWAYYCYRMRITSYRDTRAEQFNEAIEFINNWKPKVELMQEIEMLNNQIQMDI